MNWLPKVGVIRERDYADMFAAAGTIQAGRDSTSSSFELKSTGLAVYVPYLNSPVIVVDGYAVTVSTNSDLTVTLPAKSISYVYAVLNMAGGGTNVTAVGLAAYQTPTYIRHSKLLAIVYTDETAVTNTVYACDRHKPFANSFPNPPYTSSYTGAKTKTAAWLGGKAVTGTTPTKIWRLVPEFTGVLQLSFRLASNGSFTGTCKVYIDSVGASPQITVTVTGTYRDFENLPIVVAAGDVVEMELYNSNASGVTTASLISIAWAEATPYAPALLIDSGTV